MSTPPQPPLDAAEDDPDAGEAAQMPGYGAGATTDGDGPRAEPAVGPPAQDSP